jgi:nucleoside-diphosphate-sugar epimerase
MIVVTGASGLIGNVLVRELLARGRQMYRVNLRGTQNVLEACRQAIAFRRLPVHIGHRSITRRQFPFQLLGFSLA